MSFLWSLQTWLYSTILPIPVASPSSPIRRLLRLGLGAELHERDNEAGGAMRYEARLAWVASFTYILPLDI